MTSKPNEKTSKQTTDQNNQQGWTGVFNYAAALQRGKLGKELRMAFLLYDDQ